MDDNKWIFERIDGFGEAEAISCDGKVHSYKDLSGQIDLYFEELCAQIDAGKSVMVLSDYNFYAIALFFALLRLKAIVIPVTISNSEEIAARQEVSCPDYIIDMSKDGELHIESRDADREAHPLLARIKKEGSAGLILFSSGSTGKPKAMVHDLDRLCHNYHTRAVKHICFLVFLMFDHIGGLNTLLNCIAMGAKIVLPSNRSPEHVAELIERERVQILPTSPTFLNLLLMSNAHEKYDLSSLRMITYGTEAMSENLLGRLKQAFPRTRLLQTFGTSETGIAQTVSKSSSSNFLKFDDPNLEYKIVDGELYLRSNTQISGYLNASMERFSEDGWFRTGDLVEEDGEGFFRIVGRKQELINVGGEKVLPSEVEETVLMMDAVKDCIAYGAANPVTNQHVVIDVVLAKEVDGKTFRSEIRKFCMKKLDSYKVPMKINIVDQVSFSERFKRKRPS